MRVLVRRILGYIHTAHEILFDRLVDMLARYFLQLMLGFHRIVLFGRLMRRLIIRVTLRQQYKTCTLLTGQTIALTSRSNTSYSHLFYDAFCVLCIASASVESPSEWPK